jgi:drug/metabolite transporter (DMT)-like permease
MLVTLLIPAVAVAIGAVVLGERIGPEAAAGYALLALGLAVIDGRATAAAADAVTRLRRGRRGA